MLLIFAVSFTRIALRGFQTKNIHGNHYRTAFCLSWFMTATEIFVVSAIAIDGWACFFPVALGGALGVIVSMWLHNKLFKKPL